MSGQLHERRGSGPAATALLAVGLAAVLTFLALPIVALATEAPLGQLPALLRDPAVRDMLVVTAKTNAIANVLILVFGTPAAYLVATRRFPGRAIVLTALELPLVLPPAVAGIGLLAAFGTGGLLGPGLEARGIIIPFTQWAVVAAIVFVASPFYVRQAIAAFQGVDSDLPSAARTLGAGPVRVFTRVTFPLALSGLLAGWVLAFARGLGEFGATLMFAGNVRGVTQTLTLGIYEQLDADFDLALALGLLLVALSLVLLLLAKALPVLLGGARRATGSSRDQLTLAP